jgi:hypothetical protein
MHPLSLDFQCHAYFQTAAAQVGGPMGSLVGADANLFKIATFSNNKNYKKQQPNYGK